MSPVRVRLAELRGDLTPSELADRAGVRRATIYEIESGKATRLSLEVIDRLARALGVAPGDLFVSDPPVTGRRAR